MTLEGELARFSRGWRGPAMAALVALIGVVSSLDVLRNKPLLTLRAE